MKDYLIDFVVGMIMTFIIVSWLLWIFVWIVKIVEYFRWEANFILMAVIGVSIIAWFVYSISKYEDEETEWESDGVHQDNLQS